MSCENCPNRGGCHSIYITTEVINQLKHHINNETEQTDKILARLDRKLTMIMKALARPLPRRRRRR